MNKKQALDFLNRDGDLSVPCSRYGRSTSDCAEIAWRLEKIIQDANGDDITEDSLDSAMSLVVNDSEDVASILANYGNSEEQAEWAEWAES